jgi:hypothetical protein
VRFELAYRLSFGILVPVRPLGQNENQNDDENERADTDVHKRPPGHLLRRVVASSVLVR